MMSNPSSILPAMTADRTATPRTEPSFVAQLLQALQRTYAAMINAQEARATRVVSPYLALHDDETLARLGLTSEQIAKIRRDAPFTPRIGF